MSATYTAMLTELWRQFLALPQWQQALGSAGALAAVAVIVRVTGSLLTRSRARTLYVLDASGHASGAGARTALPRPAGSREEARVAEEPAVAEPTAESVGAQSESSPGEVPPVEPRNPDWADNRPLCPCCGYPTAMDEFNEVCPLCDWSEAEPDDELPQFTPLLPSLPRIEEGLGVEEREQELALAKENFAKYGSVYPPGERPAELAVLNERQVNLRRELRERFEYLKGDPPDISETWELIDGLLTGLREESP